MKITRPKSQGLGCAVKQVATRGSQSGLVKRPIGLIVIRTVSPYLALVGGPGRHLTQQQTDQGGSRKYPQSEGQYREQNDPKPSGGSALFLFFGR